MKKGDKLDRIDGIQRNVMTAFVEVLILESLLDKDMHSMQIKVYIEKHLENFQLADKTIYNALYRLREENIVSTVNDVHRGRVYHIEPAGIEYLKLINNELDKLYLCRQDIRKKRSAKS